MFCTERMLPHSWIIKLSIQPQENRNIFLGRREIKRKTDKHNWSKFDVSAMHCIQLRIESVFTHENLRDQW